VISKGNFGEAGTHPIIRTSWLYDSATGRPSNRRQGRRSPPQSHVFRWGRTFRLEPRVVGSSLSLVKHLGDAPPTFPCNNSIRVEFPCTLSPDRVGAPLPKFRVLRARLQGARLSPDLRSPPLGYPERSLKDPRAKPGAAGSGVQAMRNLGPGPRVPTVATWLPGGGSAVSRGVLESGW